MVKLDTNGKLGLLSLVKDGNVSALRDVFSDLSESISATIKGSKIKSIPLGDKKNREQEIQMVSEEGEVIGWLRLMNLSRISRPFKCYYLIYVQTADGYSSNGLGGKVNDRLVSALKKQKAIGILDNVIPKKDPAYGMYARRGWKPLKYYLRHFKTNGNNYMIYIPECLKKKRKRDALEKVLRYLKSNEEAIHMRENERMVKESINEFLRLYEAMLEFFSAEMDQQFPTALLRFVFTNLVGQFVFFCRKIRELIGFTGGESLQQFRLDPWLESVAMKSYLPIGLDEGRPSYEGDKALFESLPEELQRHPARYIERLPNYLRPKFLAWCKDNGITPEKRLTIGDLMTLGFDPTRMKEIVIGGKKYIFERVQLRNFKGLKKSEKLLDAIKAHHRGPDLVVNSPLLAIKDRGNAYVLREKIEGIHWQEAVDQLLASGNFCGADAHSLVTTIKQKVVEVWDEVRKVNPNFDLDAVAVYIPWNLEYNYPLLAMDGRGFQNIWLTI